MRVGTRIKELCAALERMQVDPDTGEIIGGIHS